MHFNIQGKRALVMGSSSGIGQAIAEMLLAEGAKVTICGKNEEKLNRTASLIRADMAVACDLNQPGSGRNLVSAVTKRFGGIDILVCNTGGPPKGRFSEVSNEQWQLGFQGLWMSAVDAIQSALPGMQERRWGRIVLITSVAAKEPLPQLTVSNGLRAGLLGLAKSLSHEVAKDGITINAVLPGYTRTERLKELGVPEEKMSSQIPAERLGTPQECAALVTFLASEPAAYITGQAIAVDGGYMKGI